MSTPAPPAPVQVPALYVGDLHPDVGDDALYNVFSQIGPVNSVRVCRDSVTERSLGYGYVNFAEESSAVLAMEKLNRTPLHGKPMRIMWSRRDSVARRNGIGNVFVKNLSDLIDTVRLHEIFSTFGTVLSCKVAVGQNGKSHGYGFVQFDTQESANTAIEKLNGTTMDGKQIYVANFVRKSERILHIPDAKYTNLYMKNLDEDITEELIELKFSQFGKTTNVMIAKDDKGNSKGFGFVNFENPDSAKRALEAMNGLQLGSKTLYVARAQKKAERQQLLQRQYEEKRNEQIRKNMASNLYVKNIDDSVDENSLREFFTQYGTITSAKIMHDAKGISRGFGFVCYSTPEEANKAVTTLQGTMFHGKPLYVAVAQRKEDRQAHLHNQYIQCVTAIPGSPGAVIPAGYPSFYYTSPGVVPQMAPRPGVMYQPYGPRPGWRPAGFAPSPRPVFQPMPLTIIPNSPRQNGQHRGRMNSHMFPQSGQYMPYMQHLQQPKYSVNVSKDSNGQQRPARYNPNSHPQELSNGSVIPRVDSESHMLSSKLSAASPEQRKQILGERLFPLVEKLEKVRASKITGMLLEMDNNELLLLLESPESLAAKVEEAVDVLEHAKTNVSGQESLQANGNNYFSAEVAVS